MEVLEFHEVFRSIFSFSNVSYFLNYKISISYRDSPVSAVFWSPANHTIRKTALIRDWFTTKMVNWDFWIFKVPFFAHFSRNFNFSNMFIELTLTQFYLNLLPYPCSHFYFDTKFGNRLYSKEKRPGSPLLFWSQALHFSFEYNLLPNLISK